MAARTKRPPLLSPIEQQFRTFKEHHPGFLLLFRAGDFYELFHDDVRTAAKVLGVTLVTRGKGREAVAMTGVPAVDVEGRLRKLIEAGHKCALCEPTAKGTHHFDRRVVPEPVKKPKTVRPPIVIVGHWLDGLGELSRDAVDAVRREARGLAGRCGESHSAAERIRGEALSAAANAVLDGADPATAERAGKYRADDLRKAHNAGRAKGDTDRVGRLDEMRATLARFRRDLLKAGEPKEVNLLNEVVPEQGLTKGQIASVRSNGTTLRERLDEWRRKAAAKRQSAVGGGATAQVRSNSHGKGETPRPDGRVRDPRRVRRGPVAGGGGDRATQGRRPGRRRRDVPDRL